MLDEMHSFFEALRKPAEWPKNLSGLDPRREKELRAESEKHWHLAVEDLERLEAALIEVYEAGAEDPDARGVLFPEYRKRIDDELRVRPRDTPLWKHEASLKCRSCRKDVMRRRCTSLS
jgi:hypothetical protein